MGLGGGTCYPGEQGGGAGLGVDQERDLPGVDELWAPVHHCLHIGGLHPPAGVAHLLAQEPVHTLPVAAVMVLIQKCLCLNIFSIAPW